MRELLIFFTLSIVLFSSCNKKETDWRFSLDRNGTAPYGCYLAKEQLKTIYPNVEVETQWDIQGYIKKKNEESSGINETVVIVAKSFNSSESQIEELKSFIERGNRVVLATHMVNDALATFFQTDFTGDHYYSDPKVDSFMRFRVEHDKKFENFDFRGIHLKSFLKPKKKLAHTVLGHYYEKKKKRVNVLSQKIGKGEVILVSSPVVFTNYFLLQKDNKKYYEYLMSNTHKFPSSVQWSSSEYFMESSSKESNPGSFWGLFEHKEYKAAFWTLLCMGLLYLLFNIKRRQRAVPLRKALSNDSLAFVETVGQLYFNEKDHPNLAKKMIKHYLDYIRMKYQISSKLEGDFADKLAKKLNKDKEKTKAFANYLITINSMQVMSETDLKFLYEQIKNYS